MDDAQVGERVKAVRIKLRRTQADVAAEARVRVIAVSHLEHGVLDELSIPEVRRIMTALGMWVDLQPRWQGVDLDRLAGGAHDALQHAVLGFFDSLPGWVAAAEVTYSIFGERGAIDVLAWHAASQTLLIIELKTLLVDAGEIARKTDERRRLAATIAAGRGWHPASVAVWLIFTDTRTNRRRVEDHARILQPPGSLDGRAMRTWLRQPTGPVSALSFWTEPAAIIRRRVRPTKAEKAAALAKLEEATATSRRGARSGARPRTRAVRAAATTTSPVVGRVPPPA